MPESYYGYCSTASFMWILNYFWYTQFNMKDTWDVIKIAKLWTYKFGDWLDEWEMAYALFKLWFNITYCSWYSKKQLLDYISNPVEFLNKNTKEKYQKYIKDGKWIDWNWETVFDLSNTTIVKKIIDESNIDKIYEWDIVELISKNQNEDTLFVLGLNYYTLYDEEESEGESWWHVVLCKWIQDWKFEIYDSWPHKNPVFIDADRVVLAMNEMWPYILIMVNNEN